MKTIVKILFAGSSVLLIGIAIVVAYPSDTIVQVAEADIAMFSFASKSPTQKFKSAMDDMEIKSTPYSLNGNLIFFGEKRFQEEPEQLSERIQRKLVEHGLSKRIRRRIETTSAETKAALSGEVVPYYMSNSRIVLGGVVPAENFLETIPKRISGRTRKEMAASASAANLPSRDELITGFRWIEIVKDRKNSSHVTVSYSDDHFDLKKQFQKSSQDVDPDLEVPSCPGCKRLNRLVDLSGRNYKNSVYSGSHSHRFMQKFYIDALTRRGWEATAGSHGFQKLQSVAEFAGDDAKWMQFARGNEFLSLMVFTDVETGETVVHSTISN